VIRSHLIKQGRDLRAQLANAREGPPDDRYFESLLSFFSAKPMSQVGPAVQRVQSLVNDVGSEPAFVESGWRLICKTRSLQSARGVSRHVRLRSRDPNPLLVSVNRAAKSARFRQEGPAFESHHLHDFDFLTFLRR
jgi:hypothetical protein